MGNVKLKDIAEALNVSTVTVSNALAGRKGVSEEVRSQVVEKAKELGIAGESPRERIAFPSL